MSCDLAFDRGVRDFGFRVLDAQQLVVAEGGRTQSSRLVSHQNPP
jgi:hypothetical protein